MKHLIRLAISATKNAVDAIEVLERNSDDRNVGVFLARARVFLADLEVYAEKVNALREK